MLWTKYSERIILKTLFLILIPCVQQNRLRCFRELYSLVYLFYLLGYNPMSGYKHQYLPFRSPVSRCIIIACHSFHTASIVYISISCPYLVALIGLNLDYIEDYTRRVEF